MSGRVAPDLAVRLGAVTLKNPLICGAAAIPAADMVCSPPGPVP